MADLAKDRWSRRQGTVVVMRWSGPTTEYGIEIRCDDLRVRVRLTGEQLALALTACVTDVLVETMEIDRG